MKANNASINEVNKPSLGLKNLSLSSISPSNANLSNGLHSSNTPKSISINFTSPRSISIMLQKSSLLCACSGSNGGGIGSNSGSGGSSSGNNINENSNTSTKKQNFKKSNRSMGDNNSTIASTTALGRLSSSSLSGYNALNSNKVLLSGNEDVSRSRKNSKIYESTDNNAFLSQNRDTKHISIDKSPAKFASGREPKNVITLDKKLILNLKENLEDFHQAYNDLLVLAKKKGEINNMTPTATTATTTTTSANMACTTTTTATTATTSANIASTTTNMVSTTTNMASTTTNMASITTPTPSTNTTMTPSSSLSSRKNIKAPLRSLSTKTTGLKSEDNNNAMMTNMTKTERLLDNWKNNMNKSSISMKMLVNGSKIKKSKKAKNSFSMFINRDDEELEIEFDNNKSPQSPPPPSSSSSLLLFEIASNRYSYPTRKHISSSITLRNSLKMSNFINESFTSNKKAFSNNNTSRKIRKLSATSDEIEQNDKEQSIVINSKRKKSILQQGQIDSKPTKAGIISTMTNIKAKIVDINVINKDMTKGIQVSKLDEKAKMLKGGFGKKKNEDKMGKMQVKKNIIVNDVGIDKEQISHNTHTITPNSKRINQFLANVSKSSLSKSSSDQNKQDKLMKSNFMMSNNNSKSMKIINTNDKVNSYGGDQGILNNAGKGIIKQGNVNGKMAKSIKSYEAPITRTVSTIATPYIYYITNLQKSHKLNDNDYFSILYREHLLQTYQAMSFCKSLKPIDPKVIAQKKVFLEKKESHLNKKTLIFDLDETLIHCNESLDMPCDVRLPIRFPGGEYIEAGINIRPHAVDILKELSPIYEIIVFTASHSCYANVVLDYIDPKGQYIHHRLFREACISADEKQEGVFLKDLRIFANRSLEDIIIVDNSAYSFGYQIKNGIPIIPFYDNKHDEELKHLIPFLKFLSSFKDPRDIIFQTFKLSLYMDYDSPKQVLEKLFFIK